MHVVKLSSVSNLFSWSTLDSPSAAETEQGILPEASPSQEHPAPRNTCYCLQEDSETIFLFHSQMHNTGLEIVERLKLKA